MARISTEPRKISGRNNLIASSDIVVQVAFFKFRFQSIEQLRECIKYYQQKTRSSSRIAAKSIALELGEDWRKLRGWEVGRWFERLPMYLLEEPKRQKVLKALSKALELAENGKL